MADVVSSRPAPQLGGLDTAAMIVGVILGVGIFRAPALVASGVETEAGFIGLWLLGGALSLIGALCYAELATSFPNAGGEYHFLRRAFGQSVSFLFAWARLTVIGTGSLALLAFVFGDHAQQLVPLGPHGSALYGAALVIVLVALNVLGLRFGTAVQKIVTALFVAGLLAIIAAGLALTPGAPDADATAPEASVGFAMVFVLLTYGGWNEAAYLSAEVRGGPRRIAFALVGGVGAITVIYVLANLAYVRTLGVPGVRAADTVGIDLVQTFAGPVAAALVSVLIAFAVITSMNATILTVSRTAYALARDIDVARPLARWSDRAGAPVPAMLALGGVSLVLVGLGAVARSGFEAMVEFTAPVFWAFMFLVGIALFVLRVKEPHVVRPFRVPLYPVLPSAFCATCLWLVYASLEYARLGAIAGVVVLLVGAVPLLIERGYRKSRAKETPDDSICRDVDPDHARIGVGL